MENKQTRGILSALHLLALVESSDFPFIIQAQPKLPEELIFSKTLRKKIPDKSIEIEANNTFSSHNRTINHRHGPKKRH